MAISVQVPKDLSGIKTKVALNLTKRQIICFHDIEIGWIWVCSWYYVCVVFGAPNQFAIVRIYH